MVQPYEMLKMTMELTWKHYNLQLSSELQNVGTLFYVFALLSSVLYLLGFFFIVY